MKSCEARKVSARLFALIARRARKAVVFRRGPTKRVLLLAWDLKSDKIVPGQWFMGRIYERRCDLSPDGELLVYLAAKFGRPLDSWTAISRPPYLTALALWPSMGTWGGGGLFVDTRTLQLNHQPMITDTGKPKIASKLAPGFHLPSTFVVKPLGEYSGSGEDDPIQSIRFERDGWRMAAEGKEKSNRQYSWHYDPPWIFEKACPAARDMTLRVARHGVHKRGGRWYDESAQLVGASGDAVDLGAVDWADFDHNGDALYSKQGCLFRLHRRNAKPILVADLNDFAFEPVVAPREALVWPRSSRA